LGLASLDVKCVVYIIPRYISDNGHAMVHTSLEIR